MKVKIFWLTHGGNLPEAQTVPDQEKRIQQFLDAEVAEIVSTNQTLTDANIVVLTIFYKSK